MLALFEKLFLNKLKYPDGKNNSISESRKSSLERVQTKLQKPIKCVYESVKKENIQKKKYNVHTYTHEKK